MIKISILHGSDGLWHLYDATRKQALDLEPFKTKKQAGNARDDYQHDMDQLAEDEASEHLIFGE